MNSKEVIKKLTEDGWYQLPRKSGSHIQFKHPGKPGRVTVPGHGSKDISIGVIKSIEQQSNLKIRK